MPDNSCRAAIRKVWPQELWKQAYVVLHLENGKETPDRVGRNTDAARSSDAGCLQVNDHWHHKRPGSLWQGNYNDIFNPEFNAKVAYNIYKRNGSTWGPWYSVCTKGSKQVFSNERCGR